MIWFFWLFVGMAAMFLTRNDENLYKLTRAAVWFFVIASFLIALLNYSQTGSVTP